MSDFNFARWVQLFVWSWLAVLAGLPASAQDHTSFTPMAIQTLQHDLKRANLSNSEPTGIWSEETHQAMNLWLGRAPMTAAPITLQDLEAKYDVRMVAPQYVGEVSAIAGAPKLPFMFLQNLSIGGTEYRRHYEDPTLAGISLHQCVAACAADPRCNGISFDPGCSLMSSISYRIDMRNKTFDRQAAVLVSRHDRTGNAPVARPTLETYRAEFRPKPLPALPKAPRLRDIAGDPQQYFDLSAFPSRPKITAAEAVARGYRAGNGPVSNGKDYSTLASSLGGYAPDFHRYDWIFVSEAHRAAANAWEAALEKRGSFDVVPKLFEDARSEAVNRFGPNHPAVALLVHDMSEAMSWYRFIENDDWSGATRKRHQKASQASRLLLDTQLIGHHQAARRQAAIHIGSIFLDPLLYDENPDPADHAVRQWGRCFEHPADNLRRSKAIVRAAAAEISADQIPTKALGWLSRAEDCLTDDAYLSSLARASLALAKLTENPYIQAAAWAGLGRIRYNAGDAVGARSALEAAFSVYADPPRGGYLPFIQDFRHQIPHETVEYYNLDEPRIDDIKDILKDLGMSTLLRRAALLQFDALSIADDIDAFGVDTFHRLFTGLLLSTDDADFAAAVLAELDVLRSGRQPGEPLMALFSMLDGTNFGIEYDIEFLDAAQLLIDLPEPPAQRVGLLTRIAESKDHAGEIEKASELSRRALELISEHKIPTSDRDFARLRKLVVTARRDAGDVEALAATLADELSARLEPVCAGRLDLTAFPSLPVEQLFDDPVLSSVFLKQPIIADYLACFETHANKMSLEKHVNGSLPILRLLDVTYVLGSLNQKEKALSLLNGLDRSWAETRGRSARAMAVSRSLDGLLLADRSHWANEVRAFLQFSDSDFREQDLHYTVQLAYSFHSLGWLEEQETVETAMFTGKHSSRGMNIRTETVPDCDNGGPLCLYSLFKTHQNQDHTSSRFQYHPSPNRQIWFSDGDYYEMNSRQNGAIYLALHQMADRNYVAELFAASLYLGEAASLKAILSQDNVAREINTLKYLSTRAALSLDTGDATAATEITARVIREVGQKANSFSRYGQDPVLRMSARLRPLLETHLAATTLPLDLRRDQLNAASEDLVFAGQILQTTNTAATFAKLSSRISSAAGPQLRELQQVTAQINDLYDDLSDQGALATTANTELTALQNRRDALVDVLAQTDPQDLAGTSLTFPSTKDVMDVLAPNEAMLSYYVGQNHSYAWLFTADRLLVKRLDAPRSIVSPLVQRIRQTTTPKGFDQPLDTAALHVGYQLLVAPFEDALQDVDTLVLVPHGPLDSLPFGALLTSQPLAATPLAATDIREARLNWLVRRHALAQVPSLSAAIFLRNLGRQESAGKQPFFGVGNPVFDALPPLDGQTIRGTSPTTLASLPETEVELRTMAAVLRADPVRDLLLSHAANETSLRAAPLADYRTIAFATHGVVADELPGITEPALLLSRAEGGDGVLLASEIATLDLDANMVILSACNTASSDGSPGAEGLSGLASAFFFAGARQLMVTHWQIPSRTALEMSIGTTIYQDRSEDQQWPHAMRRATLDIIDHKGPLDYAHPMNWAAYSIVGMP